MTTAKFSQDVEKIAIEYSMNYIDAILHWCEINNCEIESAASLIMEDPSMVFNIQIEAEELHFLKKISRLPV